MDNHSAFFKKNGINKIIEKVDDQLLLLYAQDPDIQKHNNKEIIKYRIFLSSITKENLNYLIINNILSFYTSIKKNKKNHQSMALVESNNRDIKNHIEKIQNIIDSKKKFSSYGKNPIVSHILTVKIKYMENKSINSFFCVLHFWKFMIQKIFVLSKMILQCFNSDHSRYNKHNVIMFEELFISCHEIISFFNSNFKNLPMDFLTEEQRFITDNYLSMYVVFLNIMIDIIDRKIKSIQDLIRYHKTSSLAKLKLIKFNSTENKIMQDLFLVFNNNFNKVNFKFIKNIDKIVDYFVDSNFKNKKKHLDAINHLKRELHKGYNISIEEMIITAIIYIELHLILQDYSNLFFDIFANANF